jgi:hypothetical protein
MDKFQLLAYVLCIVSALSKQNAVTFKLPTQGNSHRAVTLHTPGQHSVKMLSRDLHALKHGRENHRVNRGQRFNLVNLARPGRDSMASPFNFMAQDTHHYGSLR